MKKVFAILAIAALASCGGSTEATSNGADTNTAVIDTNTAVIDTTAAADTTAPAADTTAAAH